MGSPYSLTPLTLLILAACCSCVWSAPDSNSTGIDFRAGAGILDPSRPLTPLGNVTTSLPGSDLLLDGPTGDCAEPSRVNVSKSLAEAADLVITGVVVSAAPGEAACVRPAGPPSSSAATDLVVEYNAAGAPGNGSITLLVIVQCVHKGVLTCRRNAVQNDSSVDTLGRCVVAVKVPAQAAVASKDGLPPCSVTPGFRYMMLLSSRPQAACDGAYSTAHPRVVDSIRPHLGTNQCLPYPSWPSQDTNYSGDGIAAALARTCPGAATAPTPADCGARNGCQGKACPVGAAVACVTKACEGRFMVQDFISPVEACGATFVSQVTGLPVAACDITANQLLRQSKQAQRRTGIATGKVSPTQTQVDASTGRPKLLAPDQLFADRFNSSGSGAAGQQHGQP